MPLPVLDGLRLGSCLTSLRPGVVTANDQRETAPEPVFKEQLQNVVLARFKGSALHYIWRGAWSEKLVQT